LHDGQQRFCVNALDRVVHASICPRVHLGTEGVESSLAATRRSICCEKLDTTLRQLRFSADGDSFDDALLGVRAYKPNTPNVNLCSEQLQQKLQDLAEEHNKDRAMLRHYRLLVAKLKEELENSAVAESYSPESLAFLQDLGAFAFSKGSKVVELAPSMFDNAEFKQFWTNMSANWQLQQENKPNRFRWCATLIRFALSIFVRSPAAYRALSSSGMFILPSERTLKKHLQSMALPCGFTEQTFLDMKARYDQCIVKLAAAENGLSQDRIAVLRKGYVNLVIDEVDIRKGVLFNSKSNAIVGIVSPLFAESDAHGTTATFSFCVRDHATHSVGSGFIITRIEM